MNSSRTIQTSIGEIHIWHVENYSMRIAAGEKKREIERSEVRLKLDQLGFENELKYKDSGQPFLNDHENTFLSISHSQGVLAIYIARKPIGVDLEFERNSLLEGRNYFVNSKEEKSELDQSSLQLIWGAKEAFYKKCEGNMSDLKNEVTVRSMNMEDGSIQLIYRDEEHKLSFKIIDNLYLVYTS